MTRTTYYFSSGSDRALNMTARDCELVMLMKAAPKYTEETSSLLRRGHGHEHTGTRTMIAQRSAAEVSSDVSGFAGATPASFCSSGEREKKDAFCASSHRLGWTDGRMVSASRVTGVTED